MTPDPARWVAIAIADALSEWVGEQIGTDPADDIASVELVGMACVRVRLVGGAEMLVDVNPGGGDG